MGQFYDSCPENLLDWIQRQHIFWVATAPLSRDGHVNVSPKGAFDCFHVLGPNKVWYEDLTGSGSETIAHLRENKRITIMFTAFDGPPRIVRLFGTGTAYEFGTPEYEELIPKERRKPGSRAAIVIDVHKVGSSCGYSIPFYDFRGERTLLLERMSKREAGANKNASADPRADNGLREYWATNNMLSIDGLPGVTIAANSVDAPSSVWSKEDEIDRGVRKEKERTGVIAPGQDTSIGRLGRNIADVDTKMTVAFTVGVLATLAIRVSCVSVSSSILIQDQVMYYSYMTRCWIRVEWYPAASD